jgi:hypothetical protein
MQTQVHGSDGVPVCDLGGAQPLHRLVECIRQSAAQALGIEKPHFIGVFNQGLVLGACSGGVFAYQTPSAVASEIVCNP